MQDQVKEGRTLSFFLITTNIIIVLLFSFVQNVGIISEQSLCNQLEKEFEVLLLNRFLLFVTFSGLVLLFNISIYFLIKIITKNPRKLNKRTNVYAFLTLFITLIINVINILSVNCANVAE